MALRTAFTDGFNHLPPQQNKELLTMKPITLVLIIAFFILAPVMAGAVDEKDFEQ